MKKLLLLPALTLLPWAVAQAGDCGSKQVAKSCSSTPATPASMTVAGGHDDIVDTAVAAGDFGTLVAAVQAAGLVDALRGEGPFTVFAPSDDAFAELPEGTVASLLEPENLDQLRSILTYHVVPGRLTAKDVVKGDYAATLNGQRVAFELDEGGVRVSGANVVATDVACSNGVIHVIDRVLLPNQRNVVETAVEAGKFETLAAALKAADLVGALSGEGPFTVFAPTDEAFAKLPEGTLASLLEPRNRDKLVAILKLHVVPTRLYAQDAITAGRTATLQGSTLRARIVDGKWKIDEASVILSDLDTSNGVIHVIDRVLLP